MQQEQDLTVDFDGFPKQVAQILNLWIDSEKENMHKQSKFFCTFVIQKGHSTIGILEELDASDDDIPHVDEENGIRRFIPKYASLQVYERGSYKNLLHLQLDFYELDDLSIKKILSSKILNLTNENVRFEHILKDKDSSITDLEKKLDVQIKDLNKQNLK